MNSSLLPSEAHQPRIPFRTGNSRRNQRKTPLDSLRLLIDQDMLDEIIEHANGKITDLAGSYGDKTELSPS